VTSRRDADQDDRQRPLQDTEQGPDTDPDFADEHTEPTNADEPSPEEPDESVPRGRGGMDVG
jgi:hypothetical protein